MENGIEDTLIDLCSNHLPTFLQERDIESTRIGSWQFDKVTDGNMNLIVKAYNGTKSYIFKQATPYVYKYPQISAPIERREAEIGYYREALKNSYLSMRSPTLVEVPTEKPFFIMEYIEETIPLDSYYKDKSRKGFSQQIQKEVVAYLSHLHSLDVIDKSPWQNHKLRILNHYYLFKEPFACNTKTRFFQDSDLNDFASQISFNDNIAKVAEEAGQIYLSDGNQSLLHGDLHPGSMLLKDDRVYVIDPEFSFFGPPEFDLGIFLAHHLLMLGDASELTMILDSYQNNRGVSRNISASLCLKFCGLEIIRRLLGTAKLDILPDKIFLASLLKVSESMILGSKIN